MERDEKSYSFNRNMLIAVDGSDNSRRAVTYVAGFLEGLKEFRVTILHVIAEPEDDHFPTPADRDNWLKQYQGKVEAMLQEYRRILLEHGLPPENVSIRSTLRYCPSMADCILAERGEAGYGTIVLGRQGLSRSEEFLFGSVSSKIVSRARNCAVWVVE